MKLQEIENGCSNAFYRTFIFKEQPDNSRVVALILYSTQENLIVTTSTTQLGLIIARIKNIGIEMGVTSELSIIYKNQYTIRQLTRCSIKEIDKDKLIRRTKEITAELINTAQQFIKFYREYQNSVINEEALIDAVEPLNHKIG